MIHGKIARWERGCRVGDGQRVNRRVQRAQVGQRPEECNTSCSVHHALIHCLGVIDEGRGERVDDAEVCRAFWDDGGDAVEERLRGFEVEDRRNRRERLSERRRNLRGSGLVGVGDRPVEFDDVAEIFDSNGNAVEALGGRGEFGLK